MQTTTNTSAAVGTLIAKAVIRFHESSVFFPIINTYETPQGADSVKIPIYNKLSVNDVQTGETTEATINTAGQTSIVATVARHVYAMQISDLLQLSSESPEISIMARSIGNVLAARFDSIVINLISGFSNSVGTAGSTIALTDIHEAKQILMENGAMGEMYAVLAVRQIEGAKGLSNVIDSNDGSTLVDRMNTTGSYGRIAGINILTSNQILKDVNDDATGIIFTADAISAAYKQFAGGIINIATQRQERSSADDIVGTMFIDIKKTVDDFGVQIVSDIA